MARINTKAVATRHTHEGAVACVIDAEKELRRSVMACMLWEDQFYEDGQSIADRISSLIKQVQPEAVARIAVEAREKMKLRHVPLLLARELARGTKEARLLVSDTLEQIIQRPDELTEFLAIYWKDGRQPLSAQVKKGLARAFGKFSEYQLAKYNRDEAVKLRDVMFLTHPRPHDNTAVGAEHRGADLYKRLAEGELATPDTWEVSLSAGKDKKETWERLIAEKKLGGLALLRNLRNMTQAGVSNATIAEALRDGNFDKVLPFRFISAAKFVPHLEDVVEKAMLRSLSGAEKLPGKTAILVDNSGSMYGTKVSSKSDIDRSDAACALAILLREICEECLVIGFGNEAAVIPARHGFALRDAIKGGPGGGTFTQAAKSLADRHGYDRIIIVTDEQSHESITSPNGKGYVINVASYKNGIGYGKWTHLDGWSEAVVEYIRAAESQ